MQQFRLYSALIRCLVLLPLTGTLTSLSGDTIAELIARENQVEYSRGRQTFSPAEVGLKLQVQDRLVTGAQSRATIRLTSLQKIRLDEETELTIVKQPSKPRTPLLDLLAGAFYYFSRDKEQEFEIRTRHVSGGARGTEFLVELNPDQTRVTVFDGIVELHSPTGSVSVESGFQAMALQDGTIEIRPIIEMANPIQWWLFYPGILDPEEIVLAPATTALLQDSLQRYREGDITGALAAYPSGREAASDFERVYLAGLLLGVGRTDRALGLVTDLYDLIPASRAIRILVEAVQGSPGDVEKEPASASEWLALSYHWQARYDLNKALDAVENALQLSPDFSFARVRRAELEFSFGRLAMDELNRALQKAPRNAQALALLGFMHSARGDYVAAESAFEESIRVDGALGNAWLGRGLLKIRNKQIAEGVSDLQTAATLERNRAMLRSYLGKGLALLGDPARAELELELARQFDANDPTAWLYAALLNRDQYHINRAVHMLERSLELNEQRQVYRSRLLLDRDRAVRSSNLAAIYQSAGMGEASVREASHAVTTDYANFAAHLFLANSYHALRDPTRFNLRHETVWFNELLLANLLAPVGVGAISQNISQQEYSKLFVQNPLFGLDSTSQYRSDGQFKQLATQHGAYGKFGYSLDLDYEYHSGIRPNNDLNRIEWYSQFKWELTSQDSLFVLTKYQDFESGDNFQYFDPDNSSRTFRFHERQEPLLWGSWQRTWDSASTSHTFISGGRLENSASFHEADRLPTQVVEVDFFRGPVHAGSLPGEGDIDGNFEIYIGEVQQLIETEHHRLIAGGRVQGGHFDFKYDFRSPALTFMDPAMNDWQTEGFFRGATYVYYTYKPISILHLTGGLTYDFIEYPAHFRHPPFKTGQTSRDRLLPKAAVVYAPSDRFRLRSMYSHSLGGVSFDESFRLEPAQLSGFPQAFRTLVSESLVSSIEAPHYELTGVGLDFKLRGRNYLGLRWTHSQANFHRQVGFYQEGPAASVVTPTATREDLDYQEDVIGVSVNQLLGTQWSAGVNYDIQFSDLQNQFANPLLHLEPSLNLDGRSRLHRMSGFGLWNHPSGFFARSEIDHYHQANNNLADESLTQVNLMCGLRFHNNRAELSAGVLNLTDQNYKLHPLNTYSELPRERLFMIRFRMNL